jgi:Tol biopolymer transport system component
MARPKPAYARLAVAVSIATLAAVVAGGCSGSARSRDASTAHHLVARSGYKTITIDTRSGDARELASAPQTVPAYSSRYVFVASPDGTRSAYACADDGSSGDAGDLPDLCIASTDGGPATPVVSWRDLAGAGPHSPLRPGSWSGDGRKLTFTEQFAGGNLAAPAAGYILDLSTSRTIRVPALDLRAGRWSPDGSMLAVTGARGLLIVNADTGLVTNLTARLPGSIPDFRIDEFTWSPDGSVIAFTRVQEGHLIRPLYVATADGATLRQIGVGGTGLAWSPDGRWIARAVDPHAIQNHADPCTSAPCRRLFVIRADGSEDRALAEGSADASVPVWSPDGRSIAFAGLGGLFVTSVDGGKPRRISGDTSIAGTPLIAWTEDGREIAYTAYTEEAAPFACGQGGCADGYLFVADAAGKAPPRQLYDAPVSAILSVGP